MIVAVLSGGRSSEHDVSVASGVAVRTSLQAAGHQVRAVELDRDGTWRSDGEELVLRPGRGLLDADVAFPVLHGPFGEDGTVQGLLELLDVAYVGSGVAASAVCMDKLLLKDLMAANDIPQVAYGRPGSEGDIAWPRWVKPARLGSSVGIARVERPEDMDDAVAAAAAHDPRVIVEAHSAGLEVETSVLGDRASVPGEISLTGDGWYDYEAKYTPGGMELVVPARISETARARVQELAVRAFQLAGCDGLARVDFFVDGEDVLLNELNTMPGMTETSVWGKLWEASGLAYPDALDQLCRLAVDRFARERAARF
jgi:D-alanine-D-alanine ligase